MLFLKFVKYSYSIFSFQQLHHNSREKLNYYAKSQVEKNKFSCCCWKYLNFYNFHFLCGNMFAAGGLGLVWGCGREESNEGKITIYKRLMKNANYIARIYDGSTRAPILWYLRWKIWAKKGKRKMIIEFWKNWKFLFYL